MPRKINRNKTQDLKKLADAFYRNLEITPWEYGGLGLDPKRPFGNSDVESDMLRIIGWKREGRDEEGPCYTDRQRKYVSDLYHVDLIPFLRKNWFRREDPNDVAETRVRLLKNEEYKKGKDAIRYLKDIHEAIESKTVLDFAFLAQELWRAWRRYGEEVPDEERAEE